MERPERRATDAGATRTNLFVTIKKVPPCRKQASALTSLLTFRTRDVPHERNTQDRHHSQHDSSEPLCRQGGAMVVEARQAARWRRVRTRRSARLSDAVFRRGGLAAVCAAKKRGGAALGPQDGRTRRL